MQFSTTATDGKIVLLSFYLLIFCNGNRISAFCCVVLCSYFNFYVVVFHGRRKGEAGGALAPTWILKI